MSGPSCARCKFTLVAPSVPGALTLVCPVGLVRAPGRDYFSIVVIIGSGEYESCKEASKSPQALASFRNFQSTHPPGEIIGGRRNGILVDGPVCNWF